MHSPYLEKRRGSAGCTGPSATLAAGSSVVNRSAPVNLFALRRDTGSRPAQPRLPGPGKEDDTDGTPGARPDFAIALAGADPRHSALVLTAQSVGGWAMNSAAAIRMASDPAGSAFRIGPSKPPFPARSANACLAFAPESLHSMKCLIFRRHALRRPAGGPPERGGSGIAARAMAARRGSAPDYLPASIRSSALPSRPRRPFWCSPAPALARRVLTTRIAHILATGCAFLADPR